MIQYKNHLGTISVSNLVFERIAANTAMSCFGVAALAGEVGEAPTSFFARKKPRAVVVTVTGNSLNVDLHVKMTYGINISAIVQSIINKVSYQLESVTGIPVGSVNVYVEGLKVDE